MTTAVAPAEKASPRALPQPLTSICALLVLVGAGAFAYGLSSDPQSTWLAYHSNFVFFATLSQAGLVLSCIFVTVGARWPGPVRRIAEGLGAWIPITLVLAAVGYLGGDYLFEWKREGAVHAKEVWLNEARFLRDGSRHPGAPGHPEHRLPQSFGAADAEGRCARRHRLREGHDRALDRQLGRATTRSAPPRSRAPSCSRRSSS